MISSRSERNDDVLRVEHEIPGEGVSYHHDGRDDDRAGNAQPREEIAEKKGDEEHDQHILGVGQLVDEILIDDRIDRVGMVLDAEEVAGLCEDALEAVTSPR